MIFKNKKGLTLVELLVSCVITVMVIMYGSTFFISSWKKEIESEEYNRVLQYVCGTIENEKISFSGKKISGEYEDIKEDITLNFMNGKQLPITIQKRYCKKFNGKNLPRNAQISETLASCITMSIVAEWYTPSGKKESILVNTILCVDNNALKFIQEDI